MTVVAVGIENIIRDHPRVNDFFDFFKNILAAEKAIASADFPENTKRLPP
ncbi:MAG: hypothetical protein K8R38_07380 [Verrucomicrobia bacterium]|nr:hypothetical protein [Verrucomicrobiota bacterium]